MAMAVPINCSVTLATILFTAVVAQDEVFGRDGYDILFGGPGDDLIDGGNSADQINGGDGADLLNDGNGNDNCIADSADSIDNCN